MTALCQRWGLRACIISGFLGAAALARPASTQPADAPPAPQRLTFVVHAYACFAPDGDSIVFQSNATGNWDLYAMNPDGTRLRQLTTDGAADITPVYSPDGSRIAFVSERDGNRDVYLCNADGTAQIRITSDPAHDIHPAFSRDGRRILFSSNRGNANPDDYDLYSMTVEGGDVQRITAGPEIDTYASWSPDAGKILTRRVIDGGKNNEIFILDADGRNARNLTNDPARYDGWPVWSPDGRRIAFASGVPGQGNHGIFIMNADGTGRVKLTEPLPGFGGFMYNTQPAFSPDGTKLVYTLYRPGTARESSELLMIEVPDA